MAEPKPIPLLNLLLFGIPFVTIVSTLLGEFFFGSPIFIFTFCLLIGLFCFLFYLLTVLLNAQHAIIGIFSRSLLNTSLLFFYYFFREGPTNLIGKKPFRAGIGSAFTLSCTVIFSLSTYSFWPIITSKFAIDRPLTKKEQAWEDRHNFKKMLKYYKRIYHKYPSQFQLVEDLKVAKVRSEKIKWALEKLKIKKLGRYSYFIDPWGDPYVYQPYKKLFVWRTYRFYSPHLPAMK